MALLTVQKEEIHLKEIAVGVYDRRQSALPNVHICLDAEILKADLNGRYFNPNSAKNAKCFNNPPTSSN